MQHSSCSSGLVESAASKRQAVSNVTVSQATLKVLYVVLVSDSFKAEWLGSKVLAETARLRVLAKIVIKRWSFLHYVQFAP